VMHGLTNTPTMSDNRSFEEILQSTEHYHSQYVKHLRLLYEVTSKNTSNSSRDRFNSSPNLSSDCRASTFPSNAGPGAGHGASCRRTRRLTDESDADGAAGSGDEVVFLPLTSPIPTQYVESRATVDEMYKLQGVSGYLDKEWFLRSS
jgi:hypothetical protein